MLKTQAIGLKSRLLDFFLSSFWYSCFGIVVCLLLVIIAAGLSHRQSLTQHSSPFVASSLMPMNVADLESSSFNPPHWQKITASSSADVLISQSLIFTTDGRPVTSLDPGQEYYQVDRWRFENFVPKTLDDLLLLQLPETTLQPLSENAAFVVLAAPWKVPADIDGELVYQVDSWNGDDVPAGEFINGTATVWILPWEQKGWRDENRRSH
ncbi:hypothetical protein IJJ08_00355 [bacterium]|nr:hypothetical protein [bacterium]